jgi:hypothetical protein
MTVIKQGAGNQHMMRVFSVWSDLKLYHEDQPRLCYELQSRVSTWVCWSWDSHHLVMTLAEEGTIGICYQVTGSEDIEDLSCAVVRSVVHELATAL